MKPKHKHLQNPEDKNLIEEEIDRVLNPVRYYDNFDFTYSKLDRVQIKKGLKKALFTSIK